MTLLKSWDSRCIKYMLFLFNLLFVITGIIILCVGATVHGIYGSYSNFLDDGYLSTSAFMIAIGTIIFIISFFGCCGAVKENFCMILTFSTLLIVVFIFEFAAGISGYVLRNGAKEMLVGNMNTTMWNYKNNSEDARTFDIIQRGFNCCGITEYKNWFDVFGADEVPVSCCGTVYGAINNFTCSPNTTEFYDTPCAVALGDFIGHHSVIIGAVAFAFAFIQLIGIAFSCHLSKQIRLNYQSV